MINKMDDMYDYRFNINYYGADYPVDALVRKLEMDEIYIPNFQRQYIWKVNEASLFIESLLFGLPVPTVFLAKDKYTNKLLIIDGQQRLKTLLYFIRGSFPDNRNFKLTGVIPQFNGLTFDQLGSRDRYNLLDYTIHATIIAESGDDNRMYYLFERLNTTGTPLTSQEIRNAIYHGPFCDLIGVLSQIDNWIEMYGKKERRLRDQELILRFFALHYSLDEYSGDMKEFLNRFMLGNRTLDNIHHNELEKLFSNTIEIIYKTLGSDAFKISKQFNTALYEVVMLTISKLGNIINENKITKWHEELKENYDFKTLIQARTTNRESLLRRVEFAKKML